MPKYVVTGPDGTKYPVNAPEGATQDQAFEFFKREWKAGRVQKPAAAAPAEAKPPAEKPKAGPLGMSDIPGASSAWDFLKSMPQGVVRGVTRAASRMGQAEEALATGGGEKTVPGPEETAKLVGVDRLPQPQGMAGHVGGFVGEVLGTPTTGFPGAGMLGGAISRGLGGMAAKSVPKMEEAVPVLPNVAHLLKPNRAPKMTIPSAKASGPEGQIAQRVAASPPREAEAAVVDPSEALANGLAQVLTRSGRRTLAGRAIATGAGALGGAARAVGRGAGRGAVKARALEAQGQRMYEE